jgi:lipopolysaccharide biosynthesis glycosyltransferase
VYLITDFAPTHLVIQTLANKFMNLTLIFKSVEFDDYLSYFDIPKKTHVSRAALLKFFLPKILPEVDCVLYLDIDTVICKPIHELLNFEPRLPIAATEELGVNAFHRSSTRAYFNSGVMVMSLEKLRALDLEVTVKKMVASREYMKTYVDQEIFNVLFSNSVEYLPQEFNVFICNLKFSNLGSFIKSPKIVHFVGLDKPWIYPKKTKYSKLWLESFSNGLGENPNVEQLRILKSRRGNLNFAQFFYSLIFARSRYFRGLKMLLPSPIKGLLKEFF